jgi:hypothetical protein
MQYLVVFLQLNNYLFMLCDNYNESPNSSYNRGHHGRDRMVVRFTTTCVIGAYHY